MPKTSVVVSSRNEVWEVEPGVTVLQATVRDVLAKFTGDFEVLVSFDGPPFQALPDDPRVRAFTFAQQRGTKPCLNALAEAARGRYLLKLDSHCMVSRGLDEVLQNGMEDEWVVTPRMYVLDERRWAWQDERFHDYFYLPCPFTDKRLFRFQAGGHWKRRTAERLGTSLDENMKLHGSCWFMARSHYLERLKGLRGDGAGTWSGEDIEISLKTWLGPWGGKLMVNKGGWYAHMHKGKYCPRGWHASSREVNESYLWTSTYWMADSWEGRARDLDWLVERFWPVPTWPDDWRERWREWKAQR